MVREGYWTWERPGRYEDVPLSNFAGWVATAGAVYALWTVLDGGDAGAGDDGALALYTWTWIGEGVANLLFWQRPRVALAGGSAMGVFAVPALRARLAAGRRR
jgi:putative membrane protein